jgi:hypothetical protein
VDIGNKFIVIVIIMLLCEIRGCTIGISIVQKWHHKSVNTIWHKSQRERKTAQVNYDLSFSGVVSLLCIYTQITKYEVWGIHPFSYYGILNRHEHPQYRHYVCIIYQLFITINSNTPKTNMSFV